MPKHLVDSYTIFTDWLVNRFHKVNEHYDGTLNQVHKFSLCTYVSSDKVFTYHQAIKQKDCKTFIKEIEKEIADNDQHDH